MGINIYKVAAVCMAATALCAQSANAQGTAGKGLVIEAKKSGKSIIKVADIKEITVVQTEVGYSAEPVDLGLSVLWASCNVGAKSPVEAGGYFAWGEVDEQEYYFWDKYIWSIDGSSKIFSKYTEHDGKTVLEPGDDVAQVVMGGDWRMPTKDEFQELIDNCTWEWKIAVDANGNSISGYKISNKSDASKFIFLPAAGYRWQDSLRAVGSYGNYWSSLLRPIYDDFGWRLQFYSGSHSNVTNYRCYGHTVRAVCPAPQN